MKKKTKKQTFGEGIIEDLRGLCETLNKRKEPPMAKAKRKNLAVGQHWCNDMKFHVIFRNGVALKGFAKAGTAKANCDPGQEDHVVEGRFTWWTKGKGK